MSNASFARLSRARRSLPAGVAALTASLLAVSALVVPTSASAAQVPVISASTKPGYPEVLIATVTSDSAITSVSAAVALAAGGAEVPVAFTKDATGDTWTSAPLALAALGTAQWEVTAVELDGGENTASFNRAYLLQPVLVESTVDTAPLTFTHRTLTATGQIHFYDPRTRTTGPLPDGMTGGVVGMYLQGPGWVNQTLTGEGRFSLSRTPTELPWRSETLELYITFEAEEGSVGRYFQPDQSPVITLAYIPMTATTARVVLDAGSLRTNPGKAITVSGVVQAQDGSTWKPLAGSPVRLEGLNLPSQLAVTGSDGRFSRTTKPLYSGSLAVRSTDPFLTTSAGSVPADSLKVWVAQPANLRWLSRSIDAYSLLTLEAFLTPVYDGGWSQSGTVFLQDSKDGKTGWRSLTALKADESGGISAQGWVTHPSWKYRLVFKGNHLMQPTVSRVIGTSRRDTRIIKVKLSPRTLRKGRYTTISGVVQKDNGTKFVSVGKNQKVYVLFRAKGSDTYRLKAITTTSKSGRFSQSVKAKKDGYWAAIWGTSSSRYVHASTNDLYVNVTGTSATADALPVPIGPDGPLGDSLSDQDRMRAILAAID